MKNIDFASITIRQRISTRGGGIEIALDSFGRKYRGHKMTAYQNYLGGGLLGRICNDCTFPGWAHEPKLATVATRLREYMHQLTNPDPDEQPWESMSLEQVQRMPVSGF